MRWGTAVVALPVVLACFCSCKDQGINPVAGPPVGYQSGSRLRARVRSSSPGARMLVGWRDTALDADCSFVTTEDGETRCAPTGAQILFLDQLCQSPIAVVNPDCATAPPRFASATFQSDAACAGVVRAYRVGDALTLPSRHVYVGGGAAGACLRSTNLDPAAVVYALDPVAPGDLVKATPSHAQKTDRLGLEVLVADDGARQVTGLYDVGSKRRCFSIAGAIGGGEDRCVPDAVAWATYAADATCSAPVAYQVHPTRSCPDPSVVVAYGYDGCNVRASYFTPGAKLGIDGVFSGSAPVCTPLIGQPTLYSELARDHVFYEVGAPIAAAAFAPLQNQTTGFGRLAVPVLAAGDGTELTPPRPDTFFDTGLAAPCRIYVFPDGAKRCVPVDAQPIASPSYSDEACTLEVVGVPQPPGCATTPIPVYGVRVSGDACSSDVTASEVVRLGAELQTLHAYYSPDASGACVRQAQGGAFAAVGAPVPTSSLAVVVETVE
jgi:hypothetical protein